MSRGDGHEFDATPWGWTWSQTRAVVTLRAWPTQRLDTLLAERGLYESRSRAAAAVMAGEVRLGPGGDRAAKPGQLVADDVELAVAERPAVRLPRGREAGQRARRLRARPRRAGAAWTSGASTGGFTDCLLQRGAEARDRAGRGLRRAALEAAPGPAGDRPRAHNARELEPRRAAVRRPTCRGRRVVHLAAPRCCPRAGLRAAERFDCLAMVKPQFEVGRERVGKGGVVRDAADRARRAGGGRASSRATSSGCRCCGYASSGLPGPAGQPRRASSGSPRPAAPGAVEDLEAAARRAEP